MQIKLTTTFIRLPDGQTQTLPRASRAARDVGGDPYRSNDAWLRSFSQHVSIAVDLSRELTGLRERFDLATGAEGSGEAAATIAQEIGSRWEMLWSQLDDASSLAQASGVDVAAYDKARADARDLSCGAAVVEIGEWESDMATAGRKRTVSYRVPHLEFARRALGALRAAVPAANIVRQPDAPDLRPLSHRIPWTWIVIGIAVAAAAFHFL